MSKRTPLLALVAAMTILAISGCGSAPGAGSGGSSSDDPAATEVADALGIDLADCPTDVTEALGSEVNIGTSLPLSGGPAAAFAVVADGMKAAVGEANDTFGLDTKLNLKITDDQFQPDKALANAQQLVQQDEVEAMSGIVGTANNLAVREVLNGECVPLIPATGGGSTLIDTGSYPWIVPITSPFVLDTRIWVEHVNETYANGAKIALFTGNTESGKDYVANIKRWLDETGSPSEIVVEETIEAAEAGSPSSQVTTMRNSDADVLMAAPTGAQCISLMTELANQGWDPATYLTSTCGSTSYFAAAPGAGNGVFVTLYAKDPDAARFKDDPDVQRVIDLVEQYSPGATINATTMSGYVYGENLTQAVKGAAEGDLGLSRLGILDAAQHLDYHPSLFFDGVDVRLNGLEDQVAVEAGELNAWNTDTQAFEPVKLYDFEGELTD